MAWVCPLCSSRSTQHWHTEIRRPLVGREYWRCATCDLIFVPRAFHFTPDQQIAIYQQHDNRPDDPGYRRFLGRLLEPLLPLLASRQKQASHPLQGLDFGSGPGPTLSVMLAEAGYACADYDLYFAHQPQLLERRYDFIVSSEVFEHLEQPAEVIDQLVACLQPGGYLGIMTQRPRHLEAFQQWRYLMDPTHIAFFSEACFDWLARHWSLEPCYLGADVVLLRN